MFLEPLVKSQKCTVKSSGTLSKRAMQVRDLFLNLYVSFWRNVKHLKVSIYILMETMRLKQYIATCFREQRYDQLQIRVLTDSLQKSIHNDAKAKPPKTTLCLHHNFNNTLVTYLFSTFECQYFLFLGRKSCGNCQYTYFCSYSVQTSGSKCYNFIKLT